MEKIQAKVIDEELIRKIFKTRSREGHKGLFGHTGIFAGSLTYVGAPYFASEAAVRSGSGLVSLFVYEEILEIMKIKLNEEIVRINPFIENGISENIENLKITSIVFGSGMGDTPRTLETFMRLKDFNIPLVIDADGLNVLNRIQRDENSDKNSTETFKIALREGTLKENNNENRKELEFLTMRRSVTILTPHLGEFARLVGKTVDEIRENREMIAVEFARRYKIILILKDSRTLITDGEKLYLNDTGNSSMSNGGMGDVLAGLIGSLISQNYQAMEAGVLGTYILGRCGDKLSENRFIVNPRDILNEIPLVMKTLSRV